MPPIRSNIDGTTRETIVELVINQAKSVASVASNLNIPASTVRTIANTFLRTGRTARLPRGGSRSSRIEQSHLEWLTENMDEFAGRPVEWLTNKLNEHFRIRPPLAQRTVEKAINKLTVFTLELMRAEPEGYNEPEHIEGRRQWAETVRHRPGNIKHFVYIDEAGFNLHITRRYGRAPPRSKRAFQRVPHKRGPNMSLVIAVDKTGILAHHFKQVAYNQETFIEFLEDKLFPRLEARPRILVVDNAKFHKSQRVKDAITSRGHTLLLLPPNSPHLNAAESAFSTVKPHVRQEVVQAETLHGHVASCLARIDAAMARRWIREVERNFQIALAGVPLGRLYDARHTRHTLPENYHDPYAESWDDEPGQEEDREEGEDVDVDEEEEVKEEEDEEGLKFDRMFVVGTHPFAPVRGKREIERTRKHGLA